LGHVQHFINECPQPTRPQQQNSQNDRPREPIDGGFLPGHRQLCAQPLQHVGMGSGLEATIALEPALLARQTGERWGGEEGRPSIW
jgi:hypothetical protein